MNILKLIAFGALCFEAGWLVGLFLFDKFIDQPTRKMRDEAMEGWRSSLDEIEKIQRIVMGSIPKKREDGSMVSPIQIEPRD